MGGTRGQRNHGGQRLFPYQRKVPRPAVGGATRPVRPPPRPRLLTCPASAPPRTEATRGHRAGTWRAAFTYRAIRAMPGQASWRQRAQPAARCLAGCTSDPAGRGEAAAGRRARWTARGDWLRWRLADTAQAGSAWQVMILDHSPPSGHRHRQGRRGRRARSRLSRRAFPARRSSRSWSSACLQHQGLLQNWRRAWRRKSLTGCPRNCPESGGKWNSSPTGWPNRPPTSAI